MATLPVFCNSCDAVWGARNVIGGTGAAGIEIRNVAVGPCPKCGGTGNVPDGLYNLMDDTLTVVQSAGLPPTTLQNLISLLESLSRGEITEEQVAERVEDEVPDLAPIVNVYLQKPDRLRWIMVLIAVLTVLMQGPGTINDVSELLHEQPAVAPTTPQQGGSARRSATRGKATKRKRSAKTYGQNKKRRARGAKKRR